MKGIHRAFRAAAVLLPFLVAGFAAEAATMAAGYVATPGCAAFTSSAGGTITFNRDNTGQAAESIVADVVDVTGAVLYRDEASFPVPSQMTVGTGSFSYSNPPAANPITFRLYSVAGNGLPEQIFYSNVGNCASIPYATVAVPTLGIPGLLALAAALAGAALFVLRLRA